MIETEVRFKAGDRELGMIEGLGAKLVSDYGSTDTYFTYGDPKDRKFVLRIRVGKGKAMLTFKTSARAGADTAWHEWESQISDPEALDKILRTSGFTEVVVITKNRKQFSYQGYEINFDRIEGLGTYIEIEAKSDEEGSGEAKERLERFAAEKFGATKDRLIDKGYVKLMLGE